MNNPVNIDKKSIEKYIQLMKIRKFENSKKYLLTLYPNAFAKFAYSTEQK